MNGEGLAESGEVSFSVVIPVHNEAKMLSYTLPSIHGLEPKEVIFVLDRCTDSTEKIVKEFWKTHVSSEVKTVLLNVQKKSKWRIHLNFLYDLGIRKAESPIILLSQADIIHDYVEIRKNKDALQGIVSFAVLEHPHLAPWNHFVTMCLQLFGYAFNLTRFSGVVAFSKQCYLTCPLTANDLLNFDTQLQVNFEKKKYAYSFVISKNLNLRPWVRSKLWNLGVDKYSVKKSLWKVLLFSVVRLMPEVFAGYLYARISENTISYSEVQE